MASVAVTVTGARETSRALDRVGGDLDDLGNAADRAGRVIVDAARIRAPRRSGRLSASTRATRTDTGFEVGSDLVYFPPIHNGWAAHGISANPYVAAAGTDAFPEVERVYSAEVQSICDRSVRTI